MYQRTQRAYYHGFYFTVTAYHNPWNLFAIAMRVIVPLRITQLRDNSNGPPSSPLLSLFNRIVIVQTLNISYVARRLYLPPALGFQFAKSKNRWSETVVKMHAFSANCFHY